MPEIALAPDGSRPTQLAVIRERIESALGQPPMPWAKPDTGLSAAARYSVTLEDRSRVFVKAATDEETERWLRNEYLALQWVPARFGPNVVAWLDEPGSYPILVVEDLSRAHWPASHSGVDWRRGDIDRVLAAIKDLSHVRAPSVLAPSPIGQASWPAFARAGPDRDAFLDLGLCSPAWFSSAVPFLIDAEAALDDSGDWLVHGDLRSDNICIEEERVVFVDWSHASRGHSEHDLALLLPTLQLEGGPLPFDVMPTGGAWAAAGAGTLTRRRLHDAALPPWLASVFVRLIAIQLSWAASCLGLPQPDGTDWQAIR